MSKILMTSLLALALTAGTAMAQRPTPPADGQGGQKRPLGDGLGRQGRPLGGGPGGGGIAALDTDRDGLISKNEWTVAGRQAARFEMLDVNKDGKVDRQEIGSARRAGGGTLQRGAGPRGLGGGGLRGGQPGDNNPPPAAPIS